MADGLCIDEGYARYVVPSKGNTTVYSTITDTEVREVSLGEGTISVDFTLTMRWLDANIKTHFNSDDVKAGFVVLSKAAMEKIWTPDLNIVKSVSFKPPTEWATLTKSSVLTKYVPGISMETETPAIIEVQKRIKSTVYCSFFPSAYPMDTQTCNITLASGSFEAIFQLYDYDSTSHAPSKFQSSNFEIEVSLFDIGRTNGGNMIGINVKMQRIVGPYLLKYYTPCIGIVFLTGLSFAIPVTGDTGRGGFLVTLFLTLISLFISQMVSKGISLD